MSPATAARSSRTAIRDAAVAFAVLLGLYALGTYGFPPGYFLLAWFDLFQNALWPEVAGGAYDAAFAGYCAVLAVGAASVGRVARSRRDAASPKWWSDGAGGALVVLGLLSLGFALVVRSVEDPAPAVISGVTAAALLGGGLLALRGRGRAEASLGD